MVIRKLLLILNFYEPHLIKILFLLKRKSIRLKKTYSYVIKIQITLNILLIDHAFKYNIQNMPVYNDTKVIQSL